ncbi:ABC transporter ATP-binding protein [Alkaliphilus crotonatoxidans]
MLKLLKYLKGWAILFAIIAPLMMFLEVVMDLTQPKLMADIIDIGVASGDIPFVLSQGGRMLLVALLGLIGGVSCCIFSAMAAMSMGEKLRQAVFNKIQTFSFLELDQFKTSSLITRLTNDITQIQNMVLAGLRIMVRAPLLCIGGLLMAYSLSPRLSIVFLVSVPIIVLTVLFIFKKSFPLFLSVQQKIDRVNLVMRESILGARVVKAFTIEKQQNQRFDGANDSLMETSVRAQNINMTLWPIVVLIMNFSIISILWLGGNLVNQNLLEIGKIMAFINYLIQIMNSLIMLVMLVINYSRAKASADRINEVLNTAPALKEPKNPVEIKGFDIEFKNVSFKYNQQGENVLQNISFTAREGERIGIIGATGSGKSSFISLIPRLYDVTEGQVLIGGVDVRNLSLSELRNHIGIVLQESILFSGTIEENLKFGNQRADLRLMEQAVRDAQAYDFIASEQNSYQGIVEQRGKNLSGGQKQRLSIARTLIRNPKILILDDSSSALDMATESRLQQAIKERMTACTVITIAQRITGVMEADKIIVLDQGKITAMGTHEELLSSNEIYRSIAISQLGEEVVANV